MDHPTIEHARIALRKHFRYDDFRPGQTEIIESVLEGKNTIAIMPTGGGKSICYQIPAVLFDGLTIVVSPLISLMKDQVDALSRVSIRAAFINSMLEYRDIMDRIEKARYGYFKLLYVAPERFESTNFVEQIKHIPISLFAVDEAHCISEWGHDFRPSYRRLRDAIEYLDSPPMLALSATATPDVRQDIRTQLGMHEPTLIVRGFSRDNLSFRVVHGANKFDTILRICSKGGCGIVYAGTRNSTEEIADRLQKNSFGAEAYHAGLPDGLRQAVQERFMNGGTQIVVATTAFGMGIDKADVRFVIHHDMPGTIEQYYQEAGRAGRDGKESVCTILYQSKDKSLPEFFIRQAYPDKSIVQRVYSQLFQFAGVAVGESYHGLLPITESTLASMISGFNESSIRSALDLLERSGYIRRIHATYASSTVQFLLEPERMRTWLLESAADTLAPVAMALLRTIGSEAFHFPVRVIISEISEKTFYPEDHLLSGLHQLHDSGIIEFHAGQPGSGIALLGSRLQSRDLVIDYRAFDLRQKHQMEKLHAMERYILANTCRRNMILEYFGEKDISGVCGVCDVCTSAVVFGEEERTEDRFEKYHHLILKCVAELDGKFGRTTITDILRGAKTKRVAQFRLYEIPSYGTLADSSRDALLHVIDSMLGLGWLAKTDALHPSVRLTEIGRAKLGVKVVPFSLPRPAETGEDPIADRVLYEALRACRRRIALEINTPSHILLPESVIRKLTNQKPQTEEECLSIEGFGPASYRKCGKQMLRTIRDHLEETLMTDTLTRSKSALQDLPSTLRTTFELCARGLTMDEIAGERNLTIGTVSQHISDMLERGIDLNLDQFISPDHQQAIRKAMSLIKNHDMKRMKAVLSEDITFAEIRVMLTADKKNK